jgi:glycine/D-amino acid oxidase-like deaminating enzyme
MAMNQFDVVVAGGGPAGIGAAIGAGTLGGRVAVIERHDMLGGMGTAGLVNNFCNAHKLWQGHDRPARLIIGGVFERLRTRLIERRAIVRTEMTPSAWMEPYDPAAFAEEAESMCRAAGVTLLMKRSVRAAKFDGVKPAQLTLDDGTVIEARTVVDTSGDAAVAAMAGVPFTFGRADDNSVMPLTYCYLFGPIDIEEVRRTRPNAILRDTATQQEFLFIEGLKDEVAAAKAAGELTIPRTHVVSISSVPGKIEYATVNFGRVFCDDPTDPQKLAKAEEEGRRQVEEGLAFFRKYLPGFQNIRLIELARQIGVRESRQIVGRYTLTADDLATGRQFDDVIAQCCYGVDIHDPKGIGQVIKHIGGDGHYDIPWRCLIPRTGPGNLIVGGRCISATHEAMSSFRVSPSVMAIGEAAGVTAALAARDGAAIGDVGAEAVQRRLRETGGILE